MPDPARDRDGVKDAPRPMAGLWASLTPDQQRAALAYDGEMNHGDPAFLTPRARITHALAILNAAPDFDPATATRAQVRAMWLAHHDAVRVLRPEPGQGR